MGQMLPSRPQKAPALLTPWSWDSWPPELGEVNSVLEAALLWGCSSSAGLPGMYLLCWLAVCVSCMREPSRVTCVYSCQVPSLVQVGGEGAGSSRVRMQGAGAAPTCLYGERMMLVGSKPKEAVQGQDVLT